MSATTTTPLPFTPEMQALYERACEALNGARLKRLLADLVDIHSPTGGERAASTFMAGYMRDVVGIDARYQPVNELTGNALGEMRGAGGGASLLLYAPIDTHLEGDETEDVPWVGPSLRADMVPKARIEGDMVIGLGASNPKAMVASLTEVVHALKDSGVALKGDLLLGFAGGGMPVSLPQRNNYGMSSGVYHLLAHGGQPDYAIIMKPWWVVFNEEPGMCWFKVTVWGTLGYAGIARGTPGFRSSIVPAAAMIEELEAWIQRYTARNSSGGIKADGWLASLRAGWPERPAFPSAATEICFDIRVSPRTTPAEVRAQFAEGMREILSRHPGIEASWEMYGSTPGGFTDRGNWIVQSALRGWEHVEGAPHPAVPPMGGQTDGAMIRRLGIPCARIGYPWPPENCDPAFKEGLGGMGAAYVPDLLKSARAVLYAVIDTLARERAETGL
ncbi:M20 family metallopeptidase [Zavarzinia sp.]|uniref:M20 family metallopeptidase n=1 Tax=Zavarzinia sp. TaxID=2027920 RepID=UPI003569B4B2